MHATPRGPGRQDVARRVGPTAAVAACATAAAAAVSACFASLAQAALAQAPAGAAADGAAGSGPWLAGWALALAVVAVLGYGVGALHTRRQTSRILQAARERERAWRLLHGQQAWHSDADNHCLQAPAGWAGFEMPLPLLQAQQPFERVELADASGLRWCCSGQPLHDDTGRFVGFAGTARAAHAALDVPRPEAAPGPLAAAAAASADSRRAEPAAGSGLAAAISATAPSDSDSFSFTASHDLRAPIRVVEGFTRIVKEDYGHLLDRVGNDHLERVLGAAARMNLMIDALLTLARLSAQPLARQPVNLSQLAGFVVEDLRAADPERGADIDIEEQLTVQGDPTLLRLVLENLLGNAWKYSGRTARTRITLQAVPHSAAACGGRAYMVRDNGAGFDMRSADRLFGLFQRLHSTSDFPGHGVGLASVRRIVQRHGGEIWAEAEVGKGAAFYFTLAA